MKPPWTAVWRSVAENPSSFGQSVCVGSQGCLLIFPGYTLFFFSLPRSLYYCTRADCMQVSLYVRESVRECWWKRRVAPSLTDPGALWENGRLLSSFMVYSTPSLLYRSFPPSLPHTWPLPHNRRGGDVCEFESEWVCGRATSQLVHLLLAFCHAPHRNSFHTEEESSAGANKEKVSAHLCFININDRAAIRFVRTEGLVEFTKTMTLAAPKRRNDHSGYRSFKHWS